MKKIIYILLIIFSQLCNAQSDDNILTNCSLVLSDNNYQENQFIEQTISYITDEEIIAMGEASHGASEFFTMKTDFFKYLVEHKGFKVFVIESTLATTYNLNKYLMYGEGDAKSSLAMLDNLYWNTEEVLDLINWIYEFNQNKKEEEKILFYGMDINSLPPSVEAIKIYLDKVEPAKKEKYPNLGKILFSNKKEDKALIAALEKTFSEHSEEYIGKSSNWEYHFIKQCFTNTKQANNNKAFSLEFRDKCMAENVSWIKDVTNSKLFIWAHNYHVSKYQVGKEKPMGYFLNEKYNDNFYSIGFDFKEGEIWAKKGGNVLSILLNGNRNRICKTNEPKPNTFTYLFGLLNKPIIFLDIENCQGKNTNLDKFLNSNQLMHETSALFSKKSEYAKYHINKSYDALLYIEKVSPSKHFILKE